MRNLDDGLNCTPSPAMCHGQKGPNALPCQEKRVRNLVSGRGMEGEIAQMTGRVNGLSRPGYMRYEAPMKEREPGFFYGMNLFDFVKIGLAFMLSLAGFYLIWRTFFGPPMFDPATVRAELRNLAPKQQQQQQQSPPPRMEQENRDNQGEVSVGIMPVNPPPKK